MFFCKRQWSEATFLEKSCCADPIITNKAFHRDHHCFVFHSALPNSEGGAICSMAAMVLFLRFEAPTDLQFLAMH
jgi:hypothetical protein